MTTTLEETKPKIEQPEVDEVDQIREQYHEIRITKKKLKDLREMQIEHLEQKQEWSDLQEAKTTLKGKEDKLKTALSSDSTWNDRQDEIDQQKHKLEDQEDILSLHLIAYRDKRREDNDQSAEAIDMDGEHERPIVIKAKLGKKQPIQTSLFDPRDSL